MDHARLARFEKERVKKTREEKEYQRHLKEKVNTAWLSAKAKNDEN